MTRALHLVVLALAATLSACAGASGPAPIASSSENPSGAASVWKSKCGACHVPVEPGSRQRSELETALQRHRKRVRLSEDQWSGLVDFLSQSQGLQAKAH